MLIGIGSDFHMGGSHYQKNGKDGLNRYMTKNFEVVEWVVNYFKKRGITTILNGGDLFDSANVTTYSLIRANKIFEGIEMHTDKGNHDDTSLLKKEGISAMNLVKGVIPYNTPGSVVLGGVNFVFIPWGYEIDETLIKDDMKNVLVAHGYPKSYLDDRERSIYRSSTREGVLSNKSELFDLVITGHHHTTDVFEYHDTVYLNPGSINPSVTTRGHEPSIFVLDTDDLSFERIKIPCALKIIYVSLDDPTDFLANIDDENIYRITAKTQPDKKTLIEALRKSIDIQISYETKKHEAKQIDEFWSYIHKEWPIYEEEFKKVIS